MMTPFTAVLGFGLALFAAISDGRTGRIPNWMTLPVLVIAVFFWGISEGLAGLAHSLLGALVCGVVPLFLFAKGALGGGDVKLFAALGALTGPSFGLEIQLFGFVLAAVYALARLAFEGKLLRTLANALRVGLNPLLPSRLRKPVEPELMSKVRLGIPIFVAVVLLGAARFSG